MTAFRSASASPSLAHSSTPGVASPVKPKLRIALVGAGKMGRHHARAIARLDDSAELVAVVDPSPSARALFCAAYPSVRSFDSLKSLMAVLTPDVVHVCTAPVTHETLATEAIEAGCHVYVEKPFVTNVVAAERLLSLAAAKGSRTCVGHQLLFEPAARKLFETLPVLGEIVHVESYFSFRTVRRSPDGRTPLRADEQLLDILPHSVSLLLRVLGAASPQGRSELRSIEVGPAGTVHGLVKRGRVTGSLIVTLEGRPIESYVRVVGTNGSVQADFVRGTVQRLIGPGTSGIDKVLAPFQLAWQLAGRTTRVLTARALKRQRSYPGLAEIFQSFYDSIRAGQPSPTPSSEILDTVRICEEVGGHLTAPIGDQVTLLKASSPRIAITGGTGFLGRAVVQSLISRHVPVRVLARRLPAEWDRIANAEYVACDLATNDIAQQLQGVDLVVHCAAETAGGRSDHERNSVAATERLFRAAASAHVRSVVHISSLAVLAAARGRVPLDERSPLEADRERCGPYVWGKLESELGASRLAAELGIDVKIVRPGAILDYQHFDPPGRLGKRVGNVFVAIGPKRSRLGVVDVELAANVIAWMAQHIDEVPPIVNLLAPQLPTRVELVKRLRRANPDILVVWLPRLLLVPLSWFAIGLQKLLRPRRPAIDVARVFGSHSYNTALAAELVAKVANESTDARVTAPVDASPNASELVAIEA